MKLIYTHDERDVAPIAALYRKQGYTVKIHQINEGLWVIKAWWVKPLKLVA